MSIKTKLKEAENKLEKLLAENSLVHTFSTASYPIYLSVSQNAAPQAQMELYNTAPAEGVSSNDATLRFIFVDGEIMVRTDNRLIISDDLMGKIKGCVKKMHYLFLQEYFRQLQQYNEFSDSDADEYEDELLEGSCEIIETDFTEEASTDDD